MGNSASDMQARIFDLKFGAKQLNREALRCEKAEKKEKLKIKKAIEQGNTDVARVYAQNAIRQHNQFINYLKLSSKVEAVAQRMEATQSMSQVSRDMARVVETMGLAVKNLNLEQITQTMDQFEKQFEELDVRSGVIDNAIATSTAMSSPEDQVDSLMRQVADEHGLEVMDSLSGAGAIPTSRLQAEENTAAQERLAKLRAQ